MTPPPEIDLSIPLDALAALRRGETVEAVRIVRREQGLGLKEAKARVDSVLAEYPDLRPANRSPVLHAFVGYLANSSKLPLVLGLAAGFAGLSVAVAVPEAMRERFDSGLFMVAALGVPMIVAAVAVLVWQRRWRAWRAVAIAAAAVAAPVAPTRARFAGLPDPGAGSRDRTAAGLSSGAHAALDREDPIAAIKALRAERGLGLAEAKALVDGALRERRR